MAELAFNPNSPDFVQNPYEIYKRLREEDPVHRMSNGCWLLTRYEDVDRALKDLNFSNAPHPFSVVGPHNKERFAAARVANQLMAFVDPPDHSRIRRPFNTVFHERLRKVKPIVHESATSLFAQLPRHQEVDFLSSYANRLAVEVICRFIGFPLDRNKELTGWSRQMFYLFHAIPNQEVLEQVNRSLTDFEDFVRSQLASKRSSPSDDLISLLLDAGDLTEGELINNIMLIAADGIGNVDVGLTLALHTLLSFPEQYDRLRRDPSLARSAVTECLRYDSPAQYQGRILASTAEIRGQEIPAKSIVLLALASGNRDERKAGDANEFRIDRQGFRHLSFGRGIHSCLGAALVTMQFESVFEAVAKSEAPIALAPKPIRWAARAGHRWPETLPITIG